MNRMEKIDRKIELMKRYQEEIDKRDKIYAEFERLTEQREFEKACALLKTLDDKAPFKILAEIEWLDREIEQDNDPVEETCERVGQVIGDFLVDLIEDIRIETINVNAERLAQTCKAYSQSLSGLKRRKEE